MNGITFLVVVMLLTACTQDDQPKDITKLLSAQQKQIDDLKKTVSAQANKITSLLGAVSAITTQSPPPASPSGLTGDQVRLLTGMIPECVKAVHKAEPDNDFYQQFDAYYNAATGRVENNVMLNGSRPALYAFQKCMTYKGWPLS
jgi:hypothetical protein